MYLNNGLTFRVNMIQGGYHSWLKIIETKKAVTQSNLQILSYLDVVVAETHSNTYSEC